MDQEIDSDGHQYHSSYGDPTDQGDLPEFRITVFY